MVKNRRCIVPGCTSVVEEANFRQRIKTDGHAICPIHEVDNSSCGCNEKSTFYVLHKFPESPGQRGVWLSLIGVHPDYSPSARDCVCSRHFEFGGQRKVPTKFIGKSEEEVINIVAENAHRLLLRQTGASQIARSPSGLTRFTDAMVNVVVDLEKERTDIMEEEVVFGEYV